MKSPGYSASHCTAKVDLPDPLSSGPCQWDVVCFFSFKAAALMTSLTQRRTERIRVFYGIQEYWPALRLIHHTKTPGRTEPAKHLRAMWLNSVMGGSPLSGSERYWPDSGSPSSSSTRLCAFGGYVASPSISDGVWSSCTIEVDVPDRVSDSSCLSSSIGPLVMGRVLQQ